MATHKSAAKRARQALVARTRNRANMSTMKTAIKKLRSAIEKRELTNIDALFSETQSIIAKTRRKGSIHTNNMARNIARLAAAIVKAKAAPAVAAPVAKIKAAPVAKAKAAPVSKAKAAPAAK